MKPEAQFETIANRLSQVEDPGRKAAIAMALFGKSGAALLPMMNDLAATREEARKLGLTMSTEQAEAADKLGDTMDKLWATIKGVGIQIGAALAPDVTDLANRSAELVSKVIAWIKENKDLVVTFAKVVGWVVAGGAALIALGAAVWGVGVAFGVMASIAGVIGTVFAGVATVLGFIGTALGAILSPLGLLVAGLVGLAGYFVATGDAGSWVGSILSWLGDSFGWLRDTALRAWHAITNAIASGDIGAAMNVAWATIKMYWASGIAALYPKWAEFKKWFLQIWSDVSSNFSLSWLELIFVETISNIKILWANLTAWMAKKIPEMLSILVPSIPGMGQINELLDRIEQLPDPTGQNKVAVEIMRGLTPLGAAKAASGINVPRDAVNANIEDERKRQIDRINRNRKARETELAGELEKQRQVKDGEDKARDARIDADVAAAKKAADAAKAEWDKAVDAAGVEGAAMPDGPNKPKPFAGADISGQMKSNVASTFNAFALSGLGVGGNAAEETAMNTKRMEKWMKIMLENGLKAHVRADR